MLEFIVHDIKGRCPVYRKGDRIVVDDPWSILEERDALCIHPLENYALTLGT